MRVLVAVYSRTYNTLKLANAIREAMGADLTLIENARPGLFALGGIRAGLRLKTPIKPCRTDLKDYDLLILCCPTWMLSPPPAVNRYVADLKNTQGKKFAVAVTMGGSGGDRVVKILRAALVKNGMRSTDSLVLRAGDVQRGAHFRRAAEFAARSKAKAALPYVVEETKQKVGRFVRLLNALLKIVR